MATISDPLGRLRYSLPVLIIKGSLSEIPSPKKPLHTFDGKKALYQVNIYTGLVYEVSVNTERSEQSALDLITTHRDYFLKDV